MTLVEILIITLFALAAMLIVAFIITSAYVFTSAKESYSQADTLLKEMSEMYNHMQQSLDIAERIVDNAREVALKTATTAKTLSFLLVEQDRQEKLLQEILSLTNHETEEFTPLTNSDMFDEYEEQLELDELHELIDPEILRR